MLIDRIFDIEAAAKALKIPTRDVEKLLREGHLNGKRTKEGWKINERDITAYKKKGSTETKKSQSY